MIIACFLWYNYINVSWKEKSKKMNVKKKKVELIELFYDLLFVYAISRLVELIVEPVRWSNTIREFFWLHSSSTGNFTSMVIFYKLCQQIWKMAMVWIFNCLCKYDCCNSPVFLVFCILLMCRNYQIEYLLQILCSIKICSCVFLF